jgi:hypothetical protein
MKFPVKSGQDYAIVSAGNHVAICNAVIDLGLQPGSQMYPDPKPQVYLRFEIPTEQIKYIKDGAETEGPMSIGSSFTASMHPKSKLRKFVEGWFGKKFPSDEVAGDFEFKKLLGRECLLNITHNERESKIYANIVSAAPIPKGMKADYKQHNESLYFTLDKPDAAVFEKLPEWLRTKINTRLADNPEPAATTTKMMAPDDETEIPF